MSTINVATSISHGFTGINRGDSANIGSQSDDGLQQFLHRVLTLEVGVLVTITDADDDALHAPRFVHLRNLSEDSDVEINGGSLIVMRPGDPATFPMAEGAHTFTAKAVGGTGGRILEVFIVGDSPPAET